MIMEIFLNYAKGNTKIINELKNKRVKINYFN